MDGMNAKTAAARAVRAGILLALACIGAPAAAYAAALFAHLRALFSVWRGEHLVRRSSYRKMYASRRRGKRAIQQLRACETVVTRATLVQSRMPLLCYRIISSSVRIKQWRRRASTLRMPRENGVAGARHAHRSIKSSRGDVWRRKRRRAHICAHWRVRWRACRDKRWRSRANYLVPPSNAFGYRTQQARLYNGAALAGSGMAHVLHRRDDIVNHRANIVITRAAA